MDNNQFGNGIPTDNNYQGRPMQQNMNNVPMQNTQNTNPQFVIGGQNNGYRNPNPPTQPTQNGGVYGQYNNPQYMQQQPVAPLQPPTQIPIPPVPPVPPTPQTPQTPPMPPEQPKKAKKDKGVKGKKKKKHIGLWIFLSLILIGAGIFGLFKWQNNVATEYLQDVLGSQPFTFQNSDYQDYVTENIIIPTEIETEDGKTISVNWTSSNSEILNNSGEINRPSDYNEVVTLTATVKKGLGTGEVNYDITVVKDGSISIDDVYVVTEEEIQSGVGNNNLVVMYNDNGQIASIDGFFSSTRVESVSDAEVVLQAYSDLLDLENVDFKIENIMTSIAGKQFRFEQVVDGAVVNGCYAILTTNERNQLTSINVEAHRENLSLNSAELSEEELNEILSKVCSDQFIITFSEKRIEDVDGLKTVYYVEVFDKNGYYYHLIDVNTKQILKTEDLMGLAWNQVIYGGNDVWGNRQYVTLNTESKNILGATVHEVHFENKHRDMRIADASDWGTFITMGLALKNGEEVAYVMADKNCEIVESNGDKMLQKYPEGVSSMVNLGKAYDYYEDMFGWKSFNGKSIPITCVLNMDSEDIDDNAAYTSGNAKIFFVGRAVNNANSFAGNLDVMGHEYAHGVFHAVNGDVNGKEEFDAINEAYSDIFGSLIEGNWTMGENSVKEGTLIRDVTFASSMPLYDNYAYPKEYKGENWYNAEYHDKSVVLSHVAYRMTQSGFSNEDVANIWFQSLFYGYGSNSTFLDARANVEKAARSLGYTEEQLIVIGDLFGEVKIGQKASDIIANSSVDGDVLKDDVVEKDFLVVMSPIGSLFGSPILIYEEDNSIEQTMTDAEISQMLTDHFMKQIVGEDQLPENEFGIQFDIKVEYSRMPSWIMDIVKKYAEDARKGLVDEVASQTGASEEDLEWMNLFFVVQTYHGTSYQFWTEYVGMNFSELSSQ